MENSSLLNIDLGNSNDSMLILKNDRLSMYNTIYIFLKFKCPICKKTKTYSRAFFKKKKDLAGSAARRLSALLSKNILKLIISDNSSWLISSKL